MSATTVTEPLRAWARGRPDSEAGVELLIRSGLLDHTTAAGAWTRTDGLNLDALRDRLDDYRLSGGQRRVGLVALSLLGGQGHEVDLGALVAGLDAAALDVGYFAAGLDAAALDLVLAALAHASGLPSLHPWPEGDAASGGRADATTVPLT